MSSDPSRVTVRSSLRPPSIQPVPVKHQHPLFSLCGAHKLKDLPNLLYVQYCNPRALVAIVLHANLEPGKEHDRGADAVDALARCRLAAVLRSRLLSLSSTDFKLTDFHHPLHPSFFFQFLSHSIDVVSTA